MLKSEWGKQLAFAWFVGCLFLAIGLAIDFNEADEPKNDQATSSHVEDQTSATVLDYLRRLVIATESIDRENKSDAKQAHEDNDLKAQWYQAKWAKWAFIAGSLQAVVAAFGLFFIWRSLEHSQDTTRRQLRAYLGVQSLKFELVSTPTLPALPLPAIGGGVIFRDFLTIRVKNFGQTPASLVTVWTAIVERPIFSDLLDDFDLDAEIRTATSNVFLTHAFINREQIETFKSALRNLQPLWNAQNQLSSLYLVGRVYYRDTFNQPHSTRFCFVWEPWHPHGARFVQASRFNEEDEATNPHDA